MRALKAGCLKARSRTTRIRSGQFIDRAMHLLSAVRGRLTQKRENHGTNSGKARTKIQLDTITSSWTQPGRVSETQIQPKLEGLAFSISRCINATKLVQFDVYVKNCFVCVMRIMWRNWMSWKTIRNVDRDDTRLSKPLNAWAIQKALSEILLTMASLGTSGERRSTEAVSVFASATLNNGKTGIWYVQG